MTDLRDLYQTVILDHNRSPRNFREMDGATGRAEGRNPLCGDQVAVWVKLEGDRISDVSFTGSGCAISKASASVMTTAVKGKTLTEAEGLFDAFRARVMGGANGPQAVDAGTPGSELSHSELPRSEPSTANTEPRVFRAFSGVSQFPIRVKCATLAWHALRAALAEGSAAREVTTE